MLFAVPWLGKVILGTTDSPRQDVVREPLPIQGRSSLHPERICTLSIARAKAGRHSQHLGLRPLVKPQDEDGGNTKSISREHTVLASRSGLVTVTGGKWTTYRAMAEDVLQKCFDTGAASQGGWHYQSASAGRITCRCRSAQRSATPLASISMAQKPPQWRPAR